MPSLVILEKMPVREVQFLCRVQTVNAIELFYKNSYKKEVLTRKKENKGEKDGKKYIFNDVLMTELAEKPSLISSLLQYSPMPLQLNFINGENVKKKDFLFGSVNYFF